MTACHLLHHLINRKTGWLGVAGTPGMFSGIHRYRLVQEPLRRHDRNRQIAITKE
jgi:hypothetical protein